MAARSKAQDCGHSHAGIAGSNTAGDMTVAVNVLSGRGLCDGPITLPEESYQVCVCVSLSVIGCNCNPLRLNGVCRSQTKKEIKE